MTLNMANVLTSSDWRMIPGLGKREFQFQLALVGALVRRDPASHVHLLAGPRRRCLTVCCVRTSLPVHTRRILLRPSHRLFTTS
jgi:hypothetical protein